MIEDACDILDMSAQMELWMLSGQLLPWVAAKPNNEEYDRRQMAFRFGVHLHGEVSGLQLGR